MQWMRQGCATVNVSCVAYPFSRGRVEAQKYVFIFIFSNFKRA